MIGLSAGQLDAPQFGELLYFFELTAALCAAADGSVRAANTPAPA